jgi:PAS domain-containing protein
MTLRRQLGAYLAGLHLLLFVAAGFLLIEQPLLFVGAEALLLVSLAGGAVLLRRALEPLGYTRRFHDLLQDQNYANRLASPGSAELEELVGMFNTMLAALHRERLAAGEQQGFLDRLLAATPHAILVFDFDGAISLVNASALAQLGLDGAEGKPLAAWLAGEARLAPGLDARGRERSLDLVAQLDALPVGESRMLTDLDGRRYRAQRGQFFDRGFARHFLMLEELTAELEDSERATYARLVRVLAHEVNNPLAATRSVPDSLLPHPTQLLDAFSH